VTPGRAIRPAPEGVRRDEAHGPEEIEEGTQYVNPGRGKPPGGCFRFRSPPSGVEPAGTFVAEVSLDVQDLSQLSARRDPLQLPHRWPEALVVSQSQRDARAPAGFDCALGVDPRQSERFLAKDGFAGAGRRDDLIRMQRVRRCKNDSVYPLVVQDAIQFGRQRERMARCEVARSARLPHDCMGEPQALALVLHGFDEVPSPAAEPYDRGGDHALAIL